jgi:hypothetical protein
MYAHPSSKSYETQSADCILQNQILLVSDGCPKVPRVVAAQTHKQRWSEVGGMSALWFPQPGCRVPCPCRTCVHAKLCARTSAQHLHGVGRYRCASAHRREPDIIRGTKNRSLQCHAEGGGGTLQEGTIRRKPQVRRKAEHVRSLHQTNHGKRQET